jgi:hypothetical protein
MPAAEMKTETVSVTAGNFIRAEILNGTWSFPEAQPVSDSKSVSRVA